MSLFSRESLLLVLGHESIELHAFDRDSNAWRVTAVQSGGLLGKTHETPASVAASLQDRIADLLREHASSPADLRTVVRDECARYFVVEPPDNARKVSDLRLAARLRFDGLYGDAPADWAVNADWHATRPFLACAIPAPVVSAVDNAARARRLRNVGVTTEFTSSWNAQRRRMQERRAWVVHLGRQTDVIAACAGGSVAAVSMVSRTRPVAAADMVAVLERCALRWNRPVPHTVYLLGAGAADQPVHKIGATSLVPMPPAANEMLAGAAA